MAQAELEIKEIIKNAKQQGQDKKEYKEVALVTAKNMIQNAAQKAAEKAACVIEIETEREDAVIDAMNSL